MKIMASEAPATKRTTDREQLVREIERYLAAIESFRREGCEPRWRAEYGHGGT
jgi:hypothetical protein